MLSIPGLSNYCMMILMIPFCTEGWPLPPCMVSFLVRGYNQWGWSSQPGWWSHIRLVNMTGSGISIILLIISSFDYCCGVSTCPSPVMEINGTRMSYHRPHVTSYVFKVQYYLQHCLY